MGRSGDGGGLRWEGVGGSRQHTWRRVCDSGRGWSLSPGVAAPGWGERSKSVWGVPGARRRRQAARGAED